MNQNENLGPNSDEIDFRLVVIPLWIARKKIVVIALIFAFIGGIVGFLTPVTYTASSTFLPQTTSSARADGSLSGLAALAGVNLNSTMVGGDIPPSMYATVLASEPFRKRILDAKILVNGDSVSYRSYLENQPSSALSTIQDYTIGLPGKLISVFTTNKNEKQKTNIQGLQAISNEEYGFLNSVSGKVSIVNDPKIGVIKISVVESDPIIAAQVTKVTEKVLQDWISEHKMKNAKAQYDFLVNQFAEKQKEFFSIQDQLAAYLDRNQNVLSASYLTRLQRLQAEFDLVNSIYSELAKQKEQSAIQLSKDTPTFSVLDPVKVPKERTAPKKSIYVLGSFFIGFIGSAGWFLFRDPVQKFIKGMQVNS